MTLYFGRCVNKNKNSNADKAVQEFEKELKRLIPDGCPASAGTIALAVANGMSWKDMLFKRGHFTGNDLHIPDNKVAIQRKSMSESNDLAIALSKAKGGPPADHINVNIGELVHLKLDGDKHSSWHFYLVTDIDHSRNMATIKKFIGNQLRAKQHSVKLTEIYQATFQIFKQEHQTDENSDNETELDIAMEPDHSTPVNVSERLSRPHRNRRPQLWMRCGGFWFVIWSLRRNEKGKKERLRHWLLLDLF